MRNTKSSDTKVLRDKRAGRESRDENNTREVSRRRATPHEDKPHDQTRTTERGKRHAKARTRRTDNEQVEKTVNEQV